MKQKYRSGIVKSFNYGKGKENAIISDDESELSSVKVNLIWYKLTK